MTALLTPKPLDNSIAFSTADLSPLITTCPSALSLPTSQIPIVCTSFNIF